MKSNRDKVIENSHRIYQMIKLVDAIEVSKDPRDLGITPGDRHAWKECLQSYLDRAGQILADEELKP